MTTTPRTAFITGATSGFGAAATRRNPTSAESTRGRGRNTARFTWRMSSTSQES